MIKNIAVIGGGTMGHSIALNFAIYKYPVQLWVTRQKYLDELPGIMAGRLAVLEQEGMLNGQTVDQVLAHITMTMDKKEATQDADYIIEAVPEDAKIKADLFAELDGWCKESCIFATNTSSLTLADCMAKLPESRKQRTLVCHWYNPPLLMPIAELSNFGNMPAEIYAEVEALYTSIKKVVVKVDKEVPGLVANRIQQAVAREVFWLMANEVASPEDIDKGLMFGPGFRYATTGQLAIADFGGLDIWNVVGDNLLSVMDNSQKANDILRNKVEAGELGFKSGKGFFDYSTVDGEQLQKDYALRLINQLKASEYYKKQFES
jgi:3-hydroxybutyryl-CoA dehydrogenase